MSADITIEPIGNLRSPRIDLAVRLYREQKQNLSGIF